MEAGGGSLEVAATEAVLASSYMFVVRLGNSNQEYQTYLRNRSFGLTLPPPRCWLGLVMELRRAASAASRAPLRWSGLSLGSLQQPRDPLLPITRPLPITSSS